jgi:hypothetical protein
MSCLERFDILRLAVKFKICLGNAPELLAAPEAEVWIL